MSEEDRKGLDESVDEWWISKLPPGSPLAYPDQFIKDVCRDILRAAVTPPANQAPSPQSSPAAG